MKKHFRLTLFKKVFLSIFCMILGIEIFHANQSYMSEVNYQKELLYLQIGKTMPDVITANKLFDKKYSHVYDKSFLNEFQKKTEILNEYNCMILDKEYNEVNSGDYWINEKKMQRGISFFNNDQNYYINLYSLDNKILAKIEELLIENMNQNKKSTVTIDNDSLQLVKDEIYLEAKDLKYFNINGKTFIDNKSIEKKEYTITQYLSQNYFINYSLDQNEYGNFGDIKKVKELLIHQIKNSQDTQIVIDSHIIARVVNELRDHQGYIVTYAIYYDGIHDLQQKYFNEWFGFYVLLVFIIFAISWFLAHMFTRRIKKIDIVTQQITDNHFDIQLKEKPKDELGNLSKNINHMSHQLKQTIQQLNDEIEHVKKLESLRKDFINQFTHEMKTPLGIINGYGELIEEAESDEEREKYIAIIHRETKRINQLIQSMLSLSRLEAGKVEMNIEEFDLEDSVTEIIDEYEVLFMKKNIVVKVNNIQSRVKGDKKLLETVIHNFLSNAIKHTPDNGQIEVTIDKGYAVYNSGSLIDEEDIEDIWYTFVTHDHQGSGLGLAICQSILEMHGYDYGVKNLEAGVQFYFQMKEECE